MNNQGASAFPLQWPHGWPRSRHPLRATFRTTFAGARDLMLAELHRMRARNIVVSTNIPLRQDGLPYANTKEPDDSGVAVYFTRDGRQQCIPCDKWDRARDNLRAIQHTVAALRGIERWGAKSMVDAAFTGFAALPHPDRKEPWWSVLGVDPAAPADEIKRAYRELVKRHHPDRGGDPAMFQKVHQAMKAATTNPDQEAPR